MDNLIDTRARIVDDVGELFIDRTQAIPDEYLDALKEQQREFQWNLDGFTKVASVPTVIADKWMAEGFNIYTAPAQEIIRRLRMEELDLFVTMGNRNI